MTIRARTCAKTNKWSNNKEVLKRSVSLRCYTGPKIKKVALPKWFRSSGWVKVYPKETWILGCCDSEDVDNKHQNKERWIFADSDEESEEEDYQVSEDNNELRPESADEKENRPVNI